MEEKYQIIKHIVEKELSGSAHNIDHTMRVYNLCLNLSEGQEVDLDVLKKSALLHDVARLKEDEDSSGKTDHAVLGAEMAKDILTNLSYTQNINSIQHCILTHRLRSENTPKTIEAKILFDVDKIDVIGAIGIARCFAIAGQYGQKFYSEVPLDEYIKNNLSEGKSNGRIKDMTQHTPDIEYKTKFIEIPGKLYTPKAKKFANKRMEFMEHFFNRLKMEIEGEL